MATITPVGDRWRCQVRLKKLQAIAQGRKSIAKTFATKREAEAWGRQVEAGIDQQAPAALGPEMLVTDVIAAYRRLRAELGRPVSPTSNTHYMLGHLTEDLAGERVRELSPERLVRWARMRHEQGAGGYTVNMELSQLGTLLRHTASFLNCSFPDVVGAARPLLSYGQLIAGGGRRNRRPTEDELTRLLEWVRKRNPITADAVEVAAITGLRRGEIARIAWADLDEERKAVLVRQRKHPRARLARDEWVPLLGDAWAIVQRQERVQGDPRIFRVSRETLTDSVTAGRRDLGIPDLRLHDLRRQANSALRELGFDDHARQAILGHASKEMNGRYVAVQIEDLHRQYDAARGKKPRPARQRKAADRPA